MRIYGRRHHKPVSRSPKWCQVNLSAGRVLRPSSNHHCLLGQCCERLHFDCAVLASPAAKSAAKAHSRPGYVWVAGEFSRFWIILTGVLNAFDRTGGDAQLATRARLIIPMRPVPFQAPQSNCRRAVRGEHRRIGANPAAHAAIDAARRFDPIPHPPLALDGPNRAPLNAMSAPLTIFRDPVRHD